MDKKRIYLWIQAALCTLIAVILSVSAIRIYINGIAYRADGHPTAWIYTPEVVGKALIPVIPLFIVSCLMTLMAWVFKIRDENQDKPAPFEGKISYEPEDGNNPIFRKRLRLGLLVLAVLFILIGIFNGSMKDVLIKAINVCSECIGLG